MAQVTVLSQVLQLLPRDSFNRVVKKHQSDKHSKGISTWDHLGSRDNSGELRVFKQSFFGV